MSLVVDRIKCVEETDGLGSDEIYMVVFRGRTSAPFSTGLASVGPGSAWDDFDSGETSNTDVTIAQTNSDAVYALMLIEQDDGKDVAGTDVIGAWKAQTDLIWKSIMLGFVAGGLPTNTPTARAAGFNAIRNALNGLASLYTNFPKGNDDILDVERITITNPGQSQTIRFRSNAEDATYDITFKQTAAV